MNQRMVTGLLTAGCIALAGAGYMTYKNQDRTAPEIKVDQSKKIAYTEGEDYGKLLEGVTAQDEKDGDLTNEVFVEKVVPVSKKKAVVYYGVTDKAKNVGTARREVTYQTAEDSDGGRRDRTGCSGSRRAEHRRAEHRPAECGSAAEWYTSGNEACRRNEDDSQRHIIQCAE